MKNLSEKLKGFPHLETQRKVVVKLEEELSLWEDYMNNQYDLIDQRLAKSKIYGGVSLELKSAEVRIKEVEPNVGPMDRHTLSLIFNRVRWGIELIDEVWPDSPWADGMQEFEVETIIHTLRVQLNEYHRVLNATM